MVGRGGPAGCRGGSTPVPLTQVELLSYHRQVADAAREVMEQKNRDYSPGADRFVNFRGATVFGIHPVAGMLLRIQDKMSRINTFIATGTFAVADEPIQNCIVDLVNYSILIGAWFEQERVEAGESPIPLVRVPLAINREAFLREEKGVVSHELARAELLPLIDARADQIKADRIPFPKPVPETQVPVGDADTGSRRGF